MTGARVAMPRASIAFWLAAIPIAFAVTGLGHHAVLGYGLTDIDTLMLIAEARIEDARDLQALVSGKLTGGRAGLTANFYRPVAMLGFAAERAAFGWEPAGYHAVSLFGHALCGLLVAALAMRLAIHANVPAPRAFAATSGLVFLVHPVAVEIVPAIARQPDVWVTALFLAALLLLERAWQSLGGSGAMGRIGWWSCFFCLFAATLGTKEPGALLGVAAVAWLLWLDPPDGARDWVRASLLTAACGLLIAAYALVRSRVLGEVVGGYHIDHPFETMVALVANLMWIDLAIPGFASAVGRVLPAFTDLDILRSLWFWVPLGAFVAIAALGIRRSGRSEPRGGLASIVGFACVVLVAHAALFCATRVYDRRLLYTAAAFWSLLPVAAIWWCAGGLTRASARRWAYVVAAGLSAVAAALFCVQSPVIHRYDEWQSSGEATRVLTEALADRWRALPDGASVAIANLPGGFDLDPMRATPYSGITSTNSPGIAALQAWLEDRFPGKRLLLAPLGIHRYLEPFSGFRHGAHFEGGWLHFDVPASSAVLDRRFAEARGFRLRDAGPNRVALSYRRPVDAPAPRDLFLLVVDGHDPTFVPLRALDGGAR